MITAKDKRAVIDWDEFVQNMNREAPVELNESPQQRRARVAQLEKNHEAWFKYYFSAYYTSEPAPFHLKSTKRVMENAEFFEVRPWSRELAKSGRTMMETLKLVLTGKKKNVILVSNNKENAMRLLEPYKILLEKNNRIINDYGPQQKHGSWADHYFITRGGAAFLALGKGQSPRGTRNEAVRPDLIIPDDFDTDEDCRNPETIDKYWDWFERALYATRSISNPLLVIWNGNIIAEYCSTKLAMKVADKYELVNIRDKNGKSTWPQKNTEEMIDRVLSKISYNAAQGEYFNNPITRGKVFDALHYKKLLPYKRYKFFVIYTDPSYKAGKKNDYKATIAVGRYKDEYHVKFVRCAQTTTANMLDWHYQAHKEIAPHCAVYHYIEWPSIDDPIKQELQKADKRHKMTLPLKADERNKPDKFFRIESTLEPLNTNEKLWFEERLKVSDHMKAMEAQFLAISPTSKAHDDGPDAVEGGVYIVNAKTSSDVGKISVNKHKKRNPKRW
ncbi:hypothetical protein [Croceivirga sp. JEA036]|uniref:hypothetical protein n=1 Tax=Croceivirga sp. JEA036 TaxID=2721162 RepID=UPI00143C80E6|nr:hypothetical protein [Croceivirga sp. JEA036]NJB36382.1 hypothetical protein [Croceivirga sp. JEA036]